MTREESIKLVKEVAGMSLDWDDDHYGDVCECCQDDRSSGEEDEGYIYDMEVRKE